MERVRVRRRSRKRRKRRRLRRVLIGSGFVLGVLIMIVGWLLYTGLRARTELEAVRAEVHTLRAEIAAGDLAAARDTAGVLRSHAQKAYDLTSDPLWAATAHLPAIGTPLKSVRTITNGVDRIATLVLPDLIDATDKIDPKTLRRPDGSIDLASIQAVTPTLTAADGELRTALTRIAGAPTSTWISTVDTARVDLLDQLGELSKTLDTARTAAAVLPPMLGVDGPKNYLVSFQTEAELRGTGGLPGAFAILTVDHGRFTFSKFNSDTELNRATASVDFGTDFNQLYAGDNATTEYGDSNVSPHFPYAAQIWTQMWQQHTGQHLDGAMTLDPTAVSYLLAATGPVTLPDKTRVTAHNVVALTQNTAYLRYGNRNAERKAFLVELAKAVSKHLIDTRADTTALVKAAAHAASEYRLLVWSTSAEVEDQLGHTKISGVVPDGSAPYAGVAINNGAGNKLDYFLDASLTRQSIGCGAVRDVTVTLRLSNDSPPNQPRAVLGLTNRPNVRLKPGDNILIVNYYASRGAQLAAVTLNGEVSTSGTGRERGHPVYSVRIYLPRGVPQTLVLHLREPASAEPLTVRPQPMVRPMTVKLGETPCG